MNVLEQIVQHKKWEVEKRRSEMSVPELEKSYYFTRNVISLKEALLNTSTAGIIAEFKRKSPSKGVINEKAGLTEIVTAYDEYGAAGISVLTDENFFGGSNHDFVEARDIVDRPLLRKDFIIDEYQIIEAKAIGADVILLIAAVLSKFELENYTDLAHRLGLEVLIEIHAKEELNKINDDADIIGINNRDLKTFEVDINTSLQLIRKLPSKKIIISESGLSDIHTIIQLQQAGFRGFLIGENFMKQPHPEKSFKEFMNNLKTHLPFKAETGDNV